MAINIREMIKENKEIEEVLQDCSDEFLEANLNLILTALDPDGVKPGYKIRLEVDSEEGTLNWTYVPAGEATEKQAKIDFTKRHYTYEMPNDFENLYLIDLNDIEWKESKRALAAEFKRIIAAYEKPGAFVPGIWLYGASNTGKTFATIGLLNHFANKQKTVAFVNMSDLIIVTQNSFNVNSFDKKHENYIEQARKADILVIDDIGAERPTPWFKENILLPIIDYRFKSNKTTIFSSNKTIKKYENSLKARSQNPEAEEDTNNKIVARIRSLITTEVEVKV